MTAITCSSSPSNNQVSCSGETVIATGAAEGRVGVLLHCVGLPIIELLVVVVLAACAAGSSLRLSGGLSLSAHRSPGFAHDEPSPIDRPDPADKNVRSQELEEADSELQFGHGTIVSTGSDGSAETR